MAAVDKLKPLLDQGDGVLRIPSPLDPSGPDAPSPHTDSPDTASPCTGFPDTVSGVRRILAGKAFLQPRHAPILFELSQLKAAGIPPLKAKGLLAIMLSLPNDWNYSTRGLAAICKEMGLHLRELHAGVCVEYAVDGQALLDHQQ